MSAAKLKLLIRFGRGFAAAVALGCLLAAQPAFADFQSALSAYNKGNYEEAYREFQSLARAGDQRAHRYLDRLSEKGFGTAAPSSGGGSIWSSQSGTKSESGGSSGRPLGWVQSSVERGSAKRESSGGIVAPSRDSFFAALYFLPADATIIGLQYVARVLKASELELDLRYASREGSTVVMAIFAMFWWVVILKLLHAVGSFVVRVVRDVSRDAEERV